MSTIALSMALTALAAPAGESILDRFAGSQLQLQTSANLNTFAPKLQQTQNRTVESSLLLWPRFDAGADIDVAALLAVAYEWTNSDTTTTEHEPVLSDLELTAVWTGIPKLFGIETGLGAQLGLPTSKASRARTMYFSPGVIARVRRRFELFGGELFLLLRGDYEHPVYRYSTPGLEEPLPYAPQCFGGGAGCIGQGSGLANVRDQLDWTIFVSGDWAGFSPGIFFQMAHQLPYELRDLEGIERLEDRGHTRVQTSFWIYLGYQIVDWMRAEVGYSMQRNIIGGSGRYENPFFDRDEDMRIYLGLSAGLPSR